MRPTRELAAERGESALPREKPLPEGAGAVAPGKASGLMRGEHRLRRKAQLHPGQVLRLVGWGRGKGECHCPCPGELSV